MKVLVTGGAGFIGSHVVDRLIADGHQVVVVDDLSNGKRENLNPAATFYQMDIQDPALADLFEKEKPEIVNHHAAQMDVRRAVEDPVFDARVNILGFLNVLENCVRHQVRKVIFISSGGAVYGEPEQLPAEETHPIRPITPYGVTKYTGEKYLYFYRAVHKLDYTVLRYANVYGPRQDPHGEAGVVAIFIGLLARGETPTVFRYPDGEMLRDYVFVRDVVEANIAAMSRGSGQEFNIGTGRGTSVSDLLAAVQRVMGTDIEPRYGAARPGEIRQTYLAIERAARLLDWRPKVSLEQGLYETAEWFRQHAQAKKPA
ncbi:MAG TPA: NAD-dependent epimerase/dehydratase family protein [Armatimonadota bacterium]|nr:NAD-dependent epimerase/dehydratase family protein [Armatimonadota bacterium]HOJ22347.1 NAD-dependent epimerase/dehydratase family protein [Armatimonadota bacterium]HOM83461.1 NAD-dependent epimerase/dehydratase family protein [Armatimonadota bacterium]HPO71204.1 NAD-dependent epimerase/dehydratase family protein [Armatimonadota bacterium]HPT97038.1 NAD-dependent epimerase/dehydratase family protein [Armatimonadota bacterium]